MHNTTDPPPPPPPLLAQKIQDYFTWNWTKSQWPFTLPRMDTFPNSPWKINSLPISFIASTLLHIQLLLAVSGNMPMHFFTITEQSMQTMAAVCRVSNDLLIFQGLFGSGDRYILGSVKGLSLEASLWQGAIASLKRAINHAVYI